MNFKQSKFRKKFKNNELVLGSWITLDNPSIAEIMCHSGFDWLAIDLEHSVISIDKAANLIRTIDLCGVAPFVRLTSNNRNQIKRVLDAGAKGIIVPMVNNVEDAKYAVSSTRYGPVGTRGVGLARAQNYGDSFNEYFEWQKSEITVIVQIEHKMAVQNLHEILEIDGVDGYMIGPYDLSCSLEIPGRFDNEIFVSTLLKINSIGKKLGIPSGIHVVEPSIEELKKSIDLGYKFIAYSVDIRMLDVQARLGTSVIDKK